MKRLILTILLCALTSPTLAKSVSFMTERVKCTGNDQLMPLDRAGHAFAPPANPGAGEWPSGNFTIRKVSIAHWIDPSFLAAVTGWRDRDAYAILGHSGPNGDHVSPWLVGQGSAEIDHPADAAVMFAKGEYLDVHARCWRGVHWAAFTVWYTVP